MKLKNLSITKEEFKKLVEESSDESFISGMRDTLLQTIKILFYKAVEIVEDGIKVKDVSYLNAIHAIYQHKDPMLEDED
ncbi:MAG: hypothetical protein ACI4M5_02865 [Christensenellales bacterium]